MKIFLFIINVFAVFLSVSFLAYCIDEDNTFVGISIYLIIVLILNCISIFISVGKNTKKNKKHSLISLYFKRKALEEQKKIDELSSK